MIEACNGLTKNPTQVARRSEQAYIQMWRGRADVEIVLIENFLQHCKQLTNVRRTSHTRPVINIDLNGHRQLTKLTSNSAPPNSRHVEQRAESRFHLLHRPL